VIVAYLAHPVRGAVAENLARAKRWLSYLQRTYPDRVFIAPWILSIELGEDDSDEVQRAQGIVRMAAVAARCHELWAVGCGSRDGKPTLGMVCETAAALKYDARIVTDYIACTEPPDVTHVQWWRAGMKALALGLIAFKAPAKRCADCRCREDDHYVDDAGNMPCGACGNCREFFDPDELPVVVEVR
jgi:hypothetical protein